MILNQDTGENLAHLEDSAYNHPGYNKVSQIGMMKNSQTVK